MIAAIPMPGGDPREGVGGPALRLFVPLREQAALRPPVTVTGTLVLGAEEAAELARAIDAALADFDRARGLAEGGLDFARPERGLAGGGLDFARPERGLAGGGLDFARPERGVVSGGEL